MASDSAANGADWTAAVEGAVQAEIVRRRFLLRLYLGFLLTLTVATLALLAFGLSEVLELRRHVEPLFATTARLERTDADLGRGQAGLDARLRQAEAQVVALGVDTRSALTARRLPAPAPALPAAVRALPAAQTRIETTVAALDARVQRIETSVAGAASSRAQVDERLRQVEATLAALEKAAATAPAVAPATSPPTPPPPLAATAAPADEARLRRLQSLEHRLGRLERSAVRSGAADLE